MLHLCYQDLKKKALHYHWRPMAQVDEKNPNVKDSFLWALYVHSYYIYYVLIWHPNKYGHHEFFFKSTDSDE